ncbi:hypothetical protein [Terrabacter carboxydivorans]|uniref:Uncharacterized protein n=1 Tax=Terrabacter carboxydivorans TaxID=619730 RepID=A0ABN3MEW2_9MICO
MTSTAEHHTPEPAGSKERELAYAASEAVRDINHRTISSPAIPAPQIYEVLGDLKTLGYGLEQALRQLARSLASSMSVYALYEEDGGNPEESIAYAMDSMRVAAGHASRLGEVLDSAQCDISRQGFYPPSTTLETT